MKKILKTVLAIGLVASSSFALAEGSFVFRKPSGGVDEQRNSSIKEIKNIAMCQEESNRLLKTNDIGVCYQRDGYMLNVSRSNQVNFAGHLGYEGSTFSYRGREYIVGPESRPGYDYVHTNNYCNARRFEGYFIYKTEKYDWCVNNGYQTAN